MRWLACRAVPACIVCTSSRPFTICMHWLLEAAAAVFNYTCWQGGKALMHVARLNCSEAMHHQSSQAASTDCLLEGQHLLRTLPRYSLPCNTEACRSGAQL